MNFPGKMRGESWQYMATHGKLRQHVANDVSFCQMSQYGYTCIYIYIYICIRICCSFVVFLSPAVAVVVDMAMCVYNLYIYIYIYIYIDIYTASPPTKSSGFRGFDSSRLLILRGGNSHVR